MMELSANKVIQRKGSRGRERGVYYYVRESYPGEIVVSIYHDGKERE